jgi:hypothetical protein
VIIILILICPVIFNDAIDQDISQDLGLVLAGGLKLYVSCLSLNLSQAHHIKFTGLDYPVNYIGLARMVIIVKSLLSSEKIATFFLIGPVACAINIVSP